MPKLTLSNPKINTEQLHKYENYLAKDFNLSALANAVQTGYKFVLFGSATADSQIWLAELDDRDSYCIGMLESKHIGRAGGEMDFYAFKSSSLAEQFLAKTNQLMGNSVTPVLEVQLQSALLP